MSDLRRTAAEAGRAIADALRAGAISHALGGALALGVAGVPRGTKDVDVNVFVGLVSITVDGWTGWFLSPEAIAIFKLLFFRTKDIGDLAQLVAVREDALDRAYIRRWLVEMMGEEDERVRRWDEIVARFGA